MTTGTVMQTDAPAAHTSSSLAAYLPRLRSAGILIPFVILFIVLSSSSSSFFTKPNLLNILDQQSATLIMAAAGTFVLIAGGIDLSVGATYALAAVVVAQFAQNHPVWLSVVLALLTGLVVGLVNGVVSTFLRINSLIATLSMSFIVSGVASKVTDGNLIVLTSQPQFAKIAQTEVLSIRTSIWIAVIALVVLGVTLSQTTLGRYIYAAGGNQEAARLAGVRVTGVRVAAFAASGTAAALGGIIDTSRVLSAQSSSGATLAFTVLAGIVVGGTSILGGDGAIWRTIVGVLFIALVGNGFDLLDINPLYQQITLGIILLLAVGLDAWARTSTPLIRIPSARRRRGVAAAGTEAVSGDGRSEHVEDLSGSAATDGAIRVAERRISTGGQPSASAIPTGSAIVFRNGRVLTMDDRRTVLDRGDVLVVGERIAEVGPNLAVPAGAVEIDASGGIVMPGMIDTHRHLWQTAMRGYGADWTLTQYFVWYYLEYGKLFRPEDIYAGNYLGALEAIDAGVTTTVDWSHGLQTTQHADAAVDALQAVPGRFVLAYGNIQQGPWEWSTSPQFRDFVNRRMAGGGDMLGFQMAFDVPGDPAFPEKAAFEVARELDVPVTTHAGVWGATTDESIRLMHDHGFMTPRTIYVHAATLSADSYQRIAATGGSVSVSTESEQSAGQGYPPTWQLRRHNIPVSLSMDTSVWWSGDLFTAMRTTLSADRSREHMEAHAKQETVTHHALRAQQVVEWATRGGGRVLGLDSVVGSLEPGKKADIVLIKNDRSPAMTPIINPYGHVVFQAQRGDVHTVVINGRLVKHEHRLLGVDLPAARAGVERTVEYLVGQMGEEAWRRGMNPDIPETKVLDNPYTYTDWQSDATHRIADS